jgi:hypothetical protein
MISDEETIIPLFWPAKTLIAKQLILLAQIEIGSAYGNRTRLSTTNIAATSYNNAIIQD